MYGIPGYKSYWKLKCEKNSNYCKIFILSIKASATISKHHWLIFIVPSTVHRKNKFQIGCWEQPLIAVERSLEAFVSSS